MNNNIPPILKKYENLLLKTEKKYNLVKNNMKDFENKIVKKNSI